MNMSFYKIRDLVFYLVVWKVAQWPDTIRAPINQAGNADVIAEGAYHQVAIKASHITQTDEFCKAHKSEVACLPSQG